MAGVDTVAAFAIGAFMLVAVALLLFMILVQPIWCLVDCAVDRRRSGAGKAIWIIVLVLLYGMANWFYGAFAASGAWLRRLTRLAWLVAILAFLGFLALYSVSEGFRHGIDQEWKHRRELMVMGAAAGLRS